jgi:hypothetical protein
MIPTYSAETPDLAAGFAGFSALEDTSQLATAGWMARIERSSSVVAEDRTHVFNSFLGA